MKKTSLIIFDWLWLSDINPEEDAFKQAKTPNFDRLLSQWNHSELQASWKAVWILEWQIWNSEVWHLTIWAWRITNQSIIEINNLFDTNKFKDLKIFKDSIIHAQKNNSKIHVLWLIGVAWVHWISKHLLWVIDLVPKNIEVCYHLFTDWRDSDYKSSILDVREILSIINVCSNISISSVSGRYFAMDRDNNWERIKKVYDLLFYWENATSLSPIQYIQDSYDNWCYDEFIKPVLFENWKIIEENDVIYFMNYRSDRARQLTQAIIWEWFEWWFELSKIKNNFFVSMTKYYEEYSWNVFVERDFLKNTLPEVLEQKNCTQLHLAETEKFAHVTKFFSWGKHIVYSWQKDILVPSPKVATYDMTPEMSAYKILEKYLENAHNFDFSVVNFANPDMIGHTWCMSCTVESLEIIDEILWEILDFAHKNNIELILTADHWNCEVMWTNRNPHTAHTTNLVPCIYISNWETIKLKNSWWLQDIAPTILDIMNIEKPKEMSGESLI